MEQDSWNPPDCYRRKSLSPRRATVKAQTKGRETNYYSSKGPAKGAAEEIARVRRRFNLFGGFFRTGNRQTENVVSKSGHGRNGMHIERMAQGRRIFVGVTGGGGWVAKAGGGRGDARAYG